MNPFIPIANWIKGIRAPYTFLMVIMATSAACYMLIHPNLGVEKAAFIFSAILMGGFGSKALLAVMIHALKTALLMMGCAILLLLVAITMTDADVFKDAAVEGVASGLGGSIIVIIGALLERHQSAANDRNEG